MRRRVKHARKSRGTHVQSRHGRRTYIVTGRHPDCGRPADSCITGGSCIAGGSFGGAAARAGRATPVALGLAVVHQPGAVLACLQRAGPRGSLRSSGARPGTAEVPRHHQQQPRRVLHDPGGGTEVSAFRARGGVRARRAVPGGTAAGDQRPRPRDGGAPVPGPARGRAAQPGARGRKVLGSTAALRRGRVVRQRLLLARGVPGPHSHRARSWPPLPPLAEQVAEPGRPLRSRLPRSATPLRRGSSAQRAAAPGRGARPRPLLRIARGRHRPARSAALPGHANRRVLALPRDPQLGPQHRRGRGGGPARHHRAGGPPARPGQRGAARDRRRRRAADGRLPGARAQAGRALFRLIRERDVLLHHPYESFDPVVGLIEAAADDPSVLAIKMTLYRTGKDSPVVRALQRAAENGKQVTALVELKARMDEEANILWARALEQAGVHVVYGLIGYKTHAKVALVVRREAGGLRRYVHLGTGNYNPVTARIYEDLSIFTARDDFGADATSLFNLLTGYSKPSSWKKFRVAPLNLKSVVLELIEREAQIAKETGRGRIVAKMNSLQEPDVVKALYRASQAGVQIDLMVRGICVLRPGIPGVSERIKVISVVDRFLEHSRIWFFEAGGKREVYLSSADWMQRNFMRRVEIAFPVEDAAVKERILEEVLATSLADNVKARILRADGQYERVQPGTYGTSVAPLRSQERFMALARRAAAPEAQAAVASHDVFPSTQRRREPRRKKRMG